MPLLARLQNVKWRHAVIAAVVLVLGAALFGVIAVAGGANERSTSTAAAAAPTRVGSPIDPNSTRPPDNPTLAPNDDPAADSAFGIEAQKLLDELRSHDVPFSDADANILVDIGDRNVARGIPDLNANDPEIADQVARAFPQYADQQRAESCAVSPSTSRGHSPRTAARFPRTRTTTTADGPVPGLHPSVRYSDRWTSSSPNEESGRKSRGVHPRCTYQRVAVGCSGFTRHPVAASEPGMVSGP